MHEHFKKSGAHTEELGLGLGLGLVYYSFLQKPCYAQDVEARLYITIKIYDPFFSISRVDPRFGGSSESVNETTLSQRVRCCQCFSPFWFLSKRKLMSPFR